MLNLTVIFAILLVIATLIVTEPEKEQVLEDIPLKVQAAIGDAEPREVVPPPVPPLASASAPAEPEGGIQTVPEGVRSRDFWMICTLMTLFVCKLCKLMCSRTYLLPYILQADWFGPGTQRHNLGSHGHFRSNRGHFRQRHGWIIARTPWNAETPDAPHPISSKLFLSHA